MTWCTNLIIAHFKLSSDCLIAFLSKWRTALSFNWGRFSSIILSARVVSNRHTKTVRHTVKFVMRPANTFHITEELRPALIFWKIYFASHLIFYSIKVLFFCTAFFCRAVNSLPYGLIQWGEAEVSETGDQSGRLPCIPAVCTAPSFHLLVPAGLPGKFEQLAVCVSALWQTDRHSSVAFFFFFKASTVS